MTNATFRFYGGLNDFLPMSRRKCDISVACAECATTKHMIEALGVPHTEVALILLNGESAGLDVILEDGDRVAVYPGFAALDVSTLSRVGPAQEQPGPLRFAADAHLGGLARLLRMAGFDTLYDNNVDDAELAACSELEGRIVLTRDRELLKRRTVARGCYVRALKAELQLRELAKAQVAQQLPERVREMHQHFQTCDVCQGVFWQGTHWQRMVQVLAAAGISRS